MRIIVVNVFRQLSRREHAIKSYTVKKSELLHRKSFSSFDPFRLLEGFVFVNVFGNPTMLSLTVSLKHLMSDPSRNLRRAIEKLGSAVGDIQYRFYSKLYRHYCIGDSLTFESSQLK